MYWWGWHERHHVFVVVFVVDPLLLPWHASVGTQHCLFSFHLVPMPASCTVSIFHVHGHDTLVAHDLMAIPTVVCIHHYWYRSLIPLSSYPIVQPDEYGCCCYSWKPFDDGDDPSCLDDHVDLLGSPVPPLACEPTRHESFSPMPTRRRVCPWCGSWMVVAWIS